MAVPAGRKALALAAGACLLATSCRPAPRLPEPSGPAQRPPAQQTAAIDPTTLDRKLMLGYQGWFGCPGDGSDVDAWQHWFERGAPAGAASVRVDMWPDTSELDPDERCPTPLTLPGGGAAFLYSSFHPKTVDRHFQWLESYGLPGVFLQRFTSELRSAPYRAFRDAVTANVRAAAERHGRVFAVMYDISGHPEEMLVDDLERDWRHLVDDLHVTDSPRYLRHRGRPLLGIWGLGFRDRPGSAAQAAALIEFFRNNPDPRYRVTLLGGVPARWRSLASDSRSDPDWARIYRSLDVISPWIVGRFRETRTMDRFYREVVAPDLVVARHFGMDYLPVVFPGFSWHHLRPDTPLNRIPRRGGRFFWRQIDCAVGSGATMIYGAMFDEVDEGTALFKVAPDARRAPEGIATVTLDADGEPLPSDWYLRLSADAQRRLAAGPENSPAPSPLSARPPAPAPHTPSRPPAP
jgi:hypothetical protein